MSSLKKVDNNKKYTIFDYQNFPSDYKCEIIFGNIYNMNAPSTKYELELSEVFEKEKGEEF